MTNLKDILKEFDKADLSEEMDCEYDSEGEGVHKVLSEEKVKSFLTKAITEALEAVVPKRRRISGHEWFGMDGFKKGQNATRAEVIKKKEKFVKR